MLRIMGVLSIVMSIMLMVSACGPEAPTAQPPAATEAPPAAAEVTAAPGQLPRIGGDFTEAATTDAVSFHPYLTTDTASSSYQGMVYASGLMRRDPETLELIPEMAEKWEISSDYLVFTFTLRSDLKWSDGLPITSEDFRWTYEQMMKPENEYPYRESLNFIKSYEAPDPRTIVVTVKEKFCPALEGSDAVTPLPKHVWEKYDWKDPEKNPEIMNPSVASGPFKLKEWKKDDHVIFEANESYYRGRPRLDTYTIRIVPETEVAFTMLMNGEVDSGVITPEDYEKAKANPKLQMYEWWPAAARWEYIGFNLRKEPLKDVKVRHALSYALDKETITDKVMLGLAKRTYSCFPPTSPVYNPDVPHYDYDQAKAKALLEEAGYKPGPDGILQKDGKPLKLRLLYGPHTSKTREQVATIAQAQFKEIGVSLEVQGMEWGAFLQATSQEPGDWDLMVSGWRATIEPHWMEQIWSEAFIPDLNAGAYVNKNVEELFKEGSGNCEADARERIYGEIQKIIAEDSPYIFLYYNKAYDAINKRIGGIKPSPLGIGYNIEEWYVKGD
jgi:peptide/nickel transport system substrate-binding protein